MADDATYQVPLQRQQGGTNLSIGSTGTITVESGGDINVSAGGAITINASSGLIVATSGTLQVASGGALQVATGGHLTVPVTVQSTTSGTITNFGVTTIGTTIAGAYTLADPDRAGLAKTIACTVHGATTVSQVITTASTNVTIIGTSSPAATILRTLTFTNGGQSISLISSSTTAWLIKSNVGVVALTS